MKAAHPTILRVVVKGDPINSFLENPMKPIDFRAWLASRRERGFSELDCATILGCGRNSVTRWKRYPAPEYIGLAISAIEGGLKAWKRP